MFYCSCANLITGERDLRDEGVCLSVCRLSYNRYLFPCVQRVLPSIQTMSPSRVRSAECLVSADPSIHSFIHSFTLVWDKSWQSQLLTRWNSKIYKRSNKQRENSSKSHMSNTDSVSRWGICRSAYPYICCFTRIAPHWTDSGCHIRDVYCVTEPRE